MYSYMSAVKENSRRLRGGIAVKRILTVEKKHIFDYISNS